MDQFARVAMVAQNLRVFSSLATGVGRATEDTGKQIRVPRSATTALAEAATWAGKVLRDGGIMVEPDRVVDRPDYCFPHQWRDSLFGVLELWLDAAGPTGDKPTGVISATAPARAAAIASALDNATMLLPGDLPISSLPLTTPAIDRALLDRLEEVAAAIPAVLEGNRAGFEHGACPIRSGKWMAA